MEKSLKTMANKPRRYTADLLVFEAFYVALRNSLIVALVPVAVFLFLAAVEDYDMTRAFMMSVIDIMEVIFVISFFINFFYYVYFIKLRSWVAYVLVVAISCLLSFMIFFSDYKEIFIDRVQALIVGAWFVLLAVILIANRSGLWLVDGKDGHYENETWLYRHALAAAPHEEEDAADPEDRYRHKYIDTDIYASDPYADEDDVEEPQAPTR